jgi:hypothetical protein
MRRIARLSFLGHAASVFIRHHKLLCHIDSPPIDARSAAMEQSVKAEALCITILVLCRCSIASKESNGKMRRKSLVRVICFLCG